jgi:hypothetical protein
MSKEELVEAYLDGRVDRRTFIRKLVAAGVSMGAAVTYAQALSTDARANPRDHYGDDHYEDDDGKVCICHATGSDKNPYVTIKVSESAARSHLRKHGPGSARAKRIGRADHRCKKKGGCKH